MALVFNKMSKQDIDFDRMAWTLKARSKDEMRLNLHGVYVSGTFLVCTDGHRMHIAKHERAIEDGLYNVISVNAKTIVLDKDTEGYDYPDWKRVVPEDDPPPEYVEEVHNPNGDDTYLLRAVYKHASYRSQYVKESYMPETDCIVKLYGERKPLVIEESTPADGLLRKALIMPLKES